MKKLRSFVRCRLCEGIGVLPEGERCHRCRGEGGVWVTVDWTCGIKITVNLTDEPIVRDIPRTSTADQHGESA